MYVIHLDIYPGLIIYIIDMEVKTIDSRMRALTKKYRELDRANTSNIWNELIHVIDQYLSGCQSDAFETFYALFAYSGDSRSPIPMISVHSVGDLLYRRQS